MSFWKFGSKWAGITSRGKRFIVDTRAKASSKAGKSEVKKSSSKKKKNVKKRRVRKRTMAKKKRNNSGGFSLRTVFKFLRIGSFIAPALPYYTARSGDVKNKLGRTIMAYGGIDTSDKFNGGLLAQMWLPFLMTNLMTIGIPKINGIIRSFK